MNIKTIKDALSEYDQDKVEVYIDYLRKLSIETKVDNKTPRNPWIKYKTDEELISFFKKVSLDGLDIDGVHITLQSQGVSYDYIALKNKMLLVYPETLFDLGLVYKDDTFKFQKQSGKVIYQHEINNPFNQNEKDIVGAYAVITNKRGQFLTLLSKDNIEKCRKVAKTDLIWSQWFHEMALKTIVKKAVKIHFADIYQNINTIDAENYDLELPLDVNIEDKSKIEAINTLEELKEYYHKNKGRNAGVLVGFNKLISKRKAEIEDIDKKKAEELKKEQKAEPEKEPGSDG